MGWNIESVEVEGQRGGVRTFNYVYTLPGDRNTRTATYRGDGLLLGNGLVRLNREQYIKHTALQHGVDPAELITGISTKVSTELTGQREMAQAR